LNSKLVRFIGDPEKRIEEDALRMLRAIRFALKPGFEIECSSFAAIRRNAEKVSRISVERITLELEKMIACQDPKRALTLLDTSDILFLIIPELSRLQDTLQDSFWHPEGDAWKHTLLVASALRGQSFELQFAGWLHDIGKAECTRYDEKDGRIHSFGHEKIGAELAEAICHRLKFSTERKEHIVWLVANHMKFHQNGDQMKKSTLRRLMASPYFGDLEKLTLADIVSSNMDFTEYDAIQDRIAAIEIEGPRRVLPPPLITGEDLIRQGLKPGPIFKVILTRVQDMQLEGILSSREDALEKLSDMISQL
ncbi:MAG: HD domain-containing protein, partial [Eubacteriales bacterium]